MKLSVFRIGCKKHELMYENFEVLCGGSILGCVALSYRRQENTRLYNATGCTNPGLHGTMANTF